MKIIYIPLDERPCNLAYTTDIFSKEHNIITPSREMLGYKKTPADKHKILEFVKMNAGDVDAMVLSMDMLFFGGLLPSRLHFDNLEYIKTVLDELGMIKSKFPKLKIYAFQLIMRTPGYNSSDEEPDYYEKHGFDIFNYGIMKHKKQLNMQCDEVSVPHEYINDFEARRETNINALIETLRCLSNNLFDFFVIPQDDSHEYGYTALDQIKVKSFIENNGIENILIYPGADEVGAALIGRAVQTKKHNVFIIESSIGGMNRIPKYEDRPQIQSITSQLEVANLHRCNSLDEAEYVIAFNTVNCQMVESWEWKEFIDEYDAVRDLNKFVSTIGEIVKTKKVFIADTAYSNGGDIKFVKLLSEKNLIQKINAYFGWNTSSNTIGFTLASLNAGEVRNDNAINVHLLDDLIYQTIVRREMYNNELSKIGLNYFDLGHKQNEVIKLERDLINDNWRKIIGDHIPTYKHSHPWNRMFEIHMEVTND